MRDRNREIADRGTSRQEEHSKTRPLRRVPEPGGSMNHAAPHRLRLRSFLVRIVFGLVLIAGAGLLTQCRMVEKSVTGVDLNAATDAHGRGHHRRRGGCVRDCNETYRKARAAEHERHRKAMCACQGDRDCKGAERKLHHDIREQLKAERRQCKRGCYNEGHGSGG